MPTTNSGNVFGSSSMAGWSASRPLPSCIVGTFDGGSVSSSVEPVSVEPVSVESVSVEPVSVAPVSVDGVTVSVDVAPRRSRRRIRRGLSGRSARGVRTLRVGHAGAAGHRRSDAQCQRQCADAADERCRTRRRNARIPLVRCGHRRAVPAHGRSLRPPADRHDSPRPL